MKRATTAETALPVWLQFGAAVRDDATGCWGAVVGIGEPFDATGSPPAVVYLRPPGGGYEWCAEIGDLVPEEGRW